MSSRADLPAILGGLPVFTEKCPVTRPCLPGANDLVGYVEEIFRTRMITNHKYVRELELRSAEYLKVKHCVAVSSGTLGLMLVVRALDLTGEVIVPSFTFTASGHSLLWNNVAPVFADVEKRTFNIDLSELSRKITKRTTAVMAVHMFGNPCEVDKIKEMTDSHGLKVVYDAAHALGSLCAGEPVGGFGDASVFSLSPSKIITSGEGGLITTNDDGLAEKLVLMRNQGILENYDCTYLGLNCRMPELCAILGLLTLRHSEEWIEKRCQLVDEYARELSSIPGIALQYVAQSNRCTYKDFTVLVEPEEFCLTRDQVRVCLDAENISTKHYYSPPLHQQRLYRSGEPKDVELPATEYIASRCLTLPLFTEMETREVQKVCEAMGRVYEHREKVRCALRKCSGKA